MERTDPRTLLELVSDLVGDLADLVRKESELVRAEVAENVRMAARAGGRLAIGAALLLGAFLALLAALVLALSKAMDPLIATLIVAIGAGLVGYGLVRSAMKQVSPSNMTPDRAARQIRKDISLVKGQAQ